MYKGLAVGVIIAAAGKGRRMGLNKQFAVIQGMPVLAHTLKKFDCLELVDGIVLVIGAEDIEYCSRFIIEKYKVSKVAEIIAGGSERQDSILNGINALKGKCEIVVTHDGARPLVAPGIIERSIEEAFAYGAAACAVPVKDTIKIADAFNFSVETPDRTRLFAVQTPQTFKFDILFKAHMKALEDRFNGTDDTMLVERLGMKIKLFEGSYENIKITTPEDIYIAEAIMKFRESKQKHIE